MNSIFCLASLFLFLNVHEVASANHLHVEQVLESSTIELDVNNDRNARQLKKSGLESRIVGGRGAGKGEFPFFVSWYWGSLLSPPGCGGSLVAPNLVLTAAHCEPITGRVVIGSRHLNPNDSTAEGQRIQIMNVVKKIIHPNFNKPRTLYNDFMLLELGSSVDTDYFPPINLNFDSKQPSNGDMLTAIGFGITAEEGEPAKILQKVDVPTVSREECKSVYGRMVDDDVSLCAGFDSGGKDGCAGDSGGPIFERINGVITQVGVTSWGIGCARPGYPGVYSRVSGIDYWLRENICKKSHDPKPSYCSSSEAQRSTPSPASPQPTKPPTSSPTKKPTRTPTISPTLKPQLTPSPTGPPTPNPTQLPTAQPTAPIATCKTCSDVEVSWMTEQNEKCASSPEILSRLCNQNGYWERNRICEYSCFLAGYGYPGDECCTDNEDIATTNPPASNSVSTIELLDIEHEFFGCDICDDIGNSWMIMVGNECPSSYLLELKCNRSTPWRNNKYCQLSCFKAGYGYSGDKCCTEDDIVDGEQDSTSIPTPSPVTSSPTISPSNLATFPPTFAPKTPSPTTLVPTTGSPTTATPTTVAPTTVAPTTSSPTTAQPTKDCIQCTDIGNSWMQDQGVACDPEHILIKRKCNRNAVWRQEKSCQYTCYMTGYGYAGDVCCPRENTI